MQANEKAPCVPIFVSLTAYEDTDLSEWQRGVDFLPQGRSTPGVDFQYFKA